MAAEGILAKVPDEIRGVLQLAVMEDLTAAEVARRLGLTPASIRSRYFRVRRKLTHLELSA